MSTQAPNLYDLSDEELLQTDLSKFDTEVEDTEEEVEEPQEELDEVDDSEEGEADDESETESDDEEDFEEETDEEDETESDEPDDSTNDSDPEEGTEDDVEEEEDPEESDEEEEENLEEQGIQELRDFYQAVTAEFRANGKDMQIFNPSDIQSLMQQGINYSQKMAGLKPIIAIGKTLKQHGLDDPDKISYLIDLHNKDPKAIAKLIKDSEMDVYEYDEATADDYKPSNKVKEETPLDEVMSDLESSPRYQDLINAVATKWDLASRQQIADNPGVLRVLSKQMEDGTFDRITAGVEYQHMIGKLKDIPYIQAYAMVEEQLNSSNVQQEPEAPKATSFKATRPVKKKVSSTAKKRKAASPQSGNNVAEEVFNPLTVSDEELLEYMEQQSKF